MTRYINKSKQQCSIKISMAKQISSFNFISLIQLKLIKAAIKSKVEIKILKCSIKIITKSIAFGIH